MSLATVKTPFQILSAQAVSAGDPTDATHVRVANDAQVHSLALEGIACIELDFPKFTDGRAFSQAHVLRRRGFVGDIRASGDVLIDQLLQLQRSGFSSAVLREGQDAAHGARLLAHYSGFYQGDVENLPHFARAA
ncbi:MAG: DUF934 domain-containing protein [Rhodoferax sp.]|jgi:uncharacterized protein (DUF934 family)|nr:DUF934 domain-containing protein [Rhodoferax sp.]MBJ7467735.1 DUF934 domain-containing protein [Rhodoferax sp.]